MPDFGIKFHLGGFIGVFGRKLNIDLVEAAFVGSVIGPFDVSFPVAEVASEEGNFDCGFFGLYR